MKLVCVISDANNNGNDELGRWVFDAQENIADIEWRHDDKIASILKANDEGELEFTYDPSGNRLSKTVIGPQFEAVYIDYYIRDAQGNVLATYRRHFDYQADLSYYTVAERAIYGSDRMGVYAYNDTVYPIPPIWTDDFRPVHTGHKKYELKNHLGNVMAVVHGRKQAVQGTGSTISHYTAIPAFSGDYSAFGVPLRGRGNGDYRWGFNGKEMDNEVKGTGAQYDYGFRIYDPRLGRFLTVDPIISLKGLYPWYSPYHFAGNSPILNIDLEGLEEADAIKMLLVKQLNTAIKKVDSEITRTQINATLIDRQISKLEETRKYSKAIRSISHGAGQGGRVAEAVGEFIMAVGNIPQLEAIDSDLEMYANYKEALENHLIEMRDQVDGLLIEEKILNESPTVNGNEAIKGRIIVDKSGSDRDIKAIKSLKERVYKADNGNTEIIERESE